VPTENGTSWHHHGNHGPRPQRALNLNVRIDMRRELVSNLYICQFLPFGAEHNFHFRRFQPTDANRDTREFQECNRMPKSCGLEWLSERAAGWALRYRERHWHGFCDATDT